MVRFCLIYLLPIIFASYLFAKSSELQFGNITIEEGLSNNSVTCINQDRMGFMWFGTSDGLNRWDGYNFKIFVHNPNDSYSISDNYILSLHAETSGLIWIGTSNGLNIYNPETEKFTCYFFDKADSNSISNDYASTIFEDSNKHIWIGTSRGLNRYNKKSDDFTRYFFRGQLDSVSGVWNNNNISAINEDNDGRFLLGTMNDFLLFDHETGESKVIPNIIPLRKRWPSVYSIYKDKSDRLWIAIANEGIAEYDSHAGLIRFYKPESENPGSFKTGVIPTSFSEDKTGNLWIGTANQGLYIFDRKSKRLINHKSTTEDENWINSNTITCMFKDKQGNIWIGTEDNGINVYLKWKKPFKYHVHDPGKSNSLAAGEVTSFYEDNNGRLWISHLSGGLSQLDPTSGKFRRTTHDPQNSASLSEGPIYDICEDKYGHIWFATSPDITCLDRKTGNFTHYRHNLSDPKSHAYTHTLCCYEDQEGIMWFGTANAGLERFNHINETFDHFMHDPADSNSISSNAVFSVFKDKSGNFWIGTQSGLNQMVYDNNGKEKFLHFQPNPTYQISDKGNTIIAFHEDRDGRFWTITDVGLSIFDRNEKKFETIIKGKDLPSQLIWGILEDDQGITKGKAGNLWLRTLRGIVKFNPETGKFRVYDERDGLKYCRSIKGGIAAFYKSKNGEIYSGGINSVTFFHPDKLTDNPDPPDIVITELKINYEPAMTGTNLTLQKSILLSDMISLDYYQNIISFEFAALDFTAPAKNSYVYKLEGINPDWIYTDFSRRFAAYTNLNPGEYTFRVKGSNNDGVWNEAGTSLTIIITPPWWKTIWAYSIYIIFLCAVIITTWKLQLRRIRIKNDLKMKNLETRKLQEIDRMKSRFFANISHEFRTPITLIIGPLENLLSRFSDEVSQKDLNIMKRSAYSLYRLINQMLDLSKFDAGKMKLQVQEQNIVPLLRGFVQLFESLAMMKNIQLIFSTNHENIFGYIDAGKLETIINNLLSNAFKFTPEGGVVGITITAPSLASSIRKEGLRKIEITVENTGPAIPAEIINKIFDRFYKTGDFEGTGIGLALTKELVEFHKGAISVTCNLDKGTVFTILLPIGIEAYFEDEMSDTVIHPRQREIMSEDAEVVKIEMDISGETETHAKKSLPILLIIEDNPDLCDYISSNLNKNYQIIEATNGEEGFEKSTQIIPDLIISDVMMPIMDGFTFCEKIKTDERTSHIPVILLTARADAESKITGLETGADDYLSKPFDTKELQIRIKNLIEQRHKLKQRFSREVTLIPLELAFNTTDEKFLQRMVDLIQNEIADPGFNVELFVSKMGMSRAQLYRKLHALCGLSVKEFVRTVRLKQAAQLLSRRTGTIAEVAYRVGFSNPAYFAECFRKQFGLLPSQYTNLENHK